MVIDTNTFWKLVNEKWLAQANMKLEGDGSDSVKDALLHT